MTTFSDCPQGRSQDFTFARRSFLQGLASFVLPSLLRPQPVLSAFGRCKPEFSIGDAVRTSWEVDGLLRSEVGQVTGICWHPVKQHWEYLIIWGGVFDGYLTDSEGLELNYYA